MSMREYRAVSNAIAAMYGKATQATEEEGDT